MCISLTRCTSTKPVFLWLSRDVIMYLPFHLLSLWHLYVNLFLVPPNGLVIYCGTIMTEEGKEKKVNIDFEPFRPINTSLYLCDNKFHTEVSNHNGPWVCSTL